MTLSVENLRTDFIMRGSVVHAVRSVSLHLNRGEILGIVGESGSGKTVLTHSILRLLRRPPASIHGSVRFEDEELLTCSENRIDAIRGNRICMIFQDPSAAFNPYMRLSDQMIESLMHHRSMKRGEALAAATAALEETGIPMSGRRIRSWPHEFSGGMLQRAMIAMSLLMRPAVILADEPTTALDVTVQARILALMKTIRDRHGVSILFITHNLGIVSGFCDRVLVMYAGMIVESGPVEKLFTSTAHPYTAALIRSVPRLGGSRETLFSIPGSPPDPAADPKGCPFFPRCGFALAECEAATPLLKPLDRDHSTACVRAAKGEAVWRK